MTEFFNITQSNPPVSHYKHSLLSCHNPRNLLSSKSTSPCLLLIGGANESSEPLGSVHLYDIHAEKWSDWSVEIPEPVMSHCAVLVEHPGNNHAPPESDCILVFGGLTQTHQFTNSLWKFEDDKWIDMSLSLNSRLMPSERMSHAMVYQKSTMRAILFGGKTNIGLSNELWFFDLKKNQWEHAITRECDLWPSQRCAHTLVLWRERFLVLFGGTNDNAMLSDLWIFDLDTQEWEEMEYTGTAPPRGASANHASSIYEDFMFTWVTDALYALDLKTLHWSKIGSMSLTNSLSTTSSKHKRTIPEDRIGTALTILGDNLFMWGGFQNSGALADLHMLPLSHISILRQSEKFGDVSSIHGNTMRGDLSELSFEETTIRATSAPDTSTTMIHNTQVSNGAVLHANGHKTTVSHASKSPFELAGFYEERCKKHNVTPNSLIVHQLKEGSFCDNGVIDLSSNVVGDVGLRPVADLLPEFGSLVTTLDLTFNGIRNTGVEYLCKILITRVTGVQKLNLSKNMISLSGVDALIKLVSNIKRIASINLNGTKVDMKHKARLNRMIEENVSIEI